MQLSNHTSGLFSVNCEELVPPLIIFDSAAENPENRSLSKRLVKELPLVTCSYGRESVARRCQVASTPKGGTDGVVYLQYAQHLTALTECSQAKPLALLSDDGPGHKTLKVLEHFVQHSVHVMPGPPNLTHIGQTLDMLFGTLKHHTCTNVALVQESKVDEVTGMPRALEVADVGLILSKPKDGSSGGPLVDTFTKSNIESAWKKVSSHLFLGWKTHERVSPTL